MIEEKFSELVNLYLDKEISAGDLQLLKAELARDSERKVEFQERCRLHQAMRLALGASREATADGRRGANRSSRSRSGSSSKRRRAAGDKRGRTSSDVAKRERRSVPTPVSGGRSSAPAPTSASTSAPVSHFPRWTLGAGLAACLAVGGLMLFPVFTDTTHFSKQSLEGVEADELAELAEKDPLDLVDRSDLRRIATAHQRVERRGASLAAEMRLMGLSPEVVADTAEAALQEVSLASTQPRDTRQRRIELLNQLKEYSPIPDLDILQSSTPRATRSAWPAGFQTSLASF
jgi:hypothetical protein